MILYHGTNSTFDYFEPNFLNSDCAIDQYGSGYYFYDSISPTIRHGNNVIFANCKIEKILDETQLKTYVLTKDNIEDIILQSPELDICLTNFGNIEDESFDKVFNYAVNLYTNLDVLYVLNAIGNDFFRYQHTHILLKKFKSITGFNCLQKKFDDFSIWVMFDESDIDIIKIVPWEEIIC